MKQSVFYVALFGAIAMPFAVHAETTTLDEVVVTAARLPQSLKQTISHATVLNEQTIRQSGASDVPTLLRSLAGVEVTQNGGLGAQSSVFMRGTNSSHVLVLLDGVRINSATAGTTALDQIMLDSIERIEVVRGNVSSLYGSEAIGGVIQLFSKRGRGKPAFSASAGLGSHGTQRVAAGFSGEVNDTSFSVNVGKVKTDGISAIDVLLVPNANPNNNGYDNNSLNAQVSHALNADHLLSASLFHTRGKSSFDSAFGLPTDINERLSNIDKLSLASDDQLGDIWHSQVRIAQGSDDSVSYTNGVQTSRFQTRNNQLVWQNNLQLAENQRLTLSAEHLAQAVAATTLFSQSGRRVNSLLAGYVGDYGIHQVQANLRQDRYSDIGVANTGLLGYGLAFADDWRVTASVSNAFKAPTLNDLFYPFTNFGFGFTYVGNPNLKPERSQNREVGLHYAGGSQQVDVTYFDNKISDLIASNLAGNTVINVNQARIDGIEVAYRGDFDRTRIAANMTLQNPRDTTTGNVLLKRAREFASASVSHDFGVWSTGAELRHSGAREDFGGFRLAAYQLMNLNANYRVDEHFNLSARVDNLFNRNYAETYSYQTPGRTLFVGLSYQQ